MCEYTGGVQLRNARLCLDCEEIHELQQCPICASETFVYLARWIPVEERRAGTRRRVRPAPDKSPATRWAQRGAVGLAALALSGWLWQSSRPTQSPPEDGPGDDAREE
jgi:hypothetical protein